eukprot:1211941-Amphidinium_carterae.1
MPSRGGPVTMRDDLTSKMQTHLQWTAQNTGWCGRRGGCRLVWNGTFVRTVPCIWGEPQLQRELKHLLCLILAKDEHFQSGDLNSGHTLSCDALLSVHYAVQSFLAFGDSRSSAGGVVSPVASPDVRSENAWLGNTCGEILTARLFLHRRPSVHTQQTQHNGPTTISPNTTDIMVVHSLSRVSMVGPTDLVVVGTCDPVSGSHGYCASGSA